jgi:crotonobetainyl-CoA:carnitine CoA-transferase CaiB-like acyl-CoA transferase
VPAPLDGIKVLELANFIAGPFCGAQLADLGADVVKVEQPGVGDASRRSPPIVADADGAGFMTLNRGKRSIALDLKSEPGRAAFMKLAGSADVLVENMRPGTMRDLGIDEPTLRPLNPRLVYCSISGFGQTGPWSDRAGQDLIAQAMSGLMSITGEPGGAPVKCGVPVADLTTALYAALSITSALYERQRSGLGQYLDLSLFESALALGVWETALYFATGEVAGPLGSAHRASAPYQAFACADGYITLGATTPSNWRNGCRALGLDHLVEDPRFVTPTARKRNEKELAALIEAVTITQPRAHWQRLMDEGGVPCGPILGYDETLAQEHTLARGMVAEVEHPKAGRGRIVASPIHMDRTPPRRPRPAPLLGQHGRDVLTEAGLSEAEIADLAGAGALALPS